MVSFSTIIGCYFAWVDRKNKDDTNYALGGQKFTAVPVRVSAESSKFQKLKQSIFLDLLFDF